MREKLTEWMQTLKRRGAALSRRTLASVALLVGLIVITAAILLYSSHKVAPAVPSTSTSPAAPTDALASLSDIANESDIWTTQTQRARQWQVARMRAVSLLIANFPAVAEATVLLEPGREAKLGCPGSPAAAAVHVTLASGATMTPALLRAIIDQTTAASADLVAENVRVIDSAGVSYTLADVQTLAPDPQRFRQAEQQYREKLQAALAYIPGITVVADAFAQGNDIGCSQVILSLPYSHAETIYHRSGCEGGGPKELVLDGIMANEARRIQNLAARIVGVPMEHVTVEWHYDAQAVTTPAVSQSAGLWQAVWMAVAGGTLACAEAAIIAGIVVRRVRRRRRRLAWSRVRAIAQRRRARTACPDAPAQAFDAIIQANLDDLVTLLSAEEPQTVAMVLSHLSPARAGKVLERFSASRQAVVAQQIAELSRANPETLRQAEHDLTRRWAGREQAQPVGGVAAVAKILQYTGQAGRRNVLETLEQHQPELAERISRRLLCFEDLVAMDPDRLAGALGSLSGEELALALWTADETVRPPLTAALSPAQREAMEIAAERIGPVRLSQVEAAQQHIVDVVREFEAGQLAWASAGRDEQLA